MDVNRDRKVSLEEWCKGAITEPYIMLCLDIDNNLDQNSLVRGKNASDVKHISISLPLENTSDKRPSLGPSTPLIGCRRISLLSPGASAYFSFTDNDNHVGKHGEQTEKTVENTSKRKTKFCKCVIS